VETEDIAAWLKREKVDMMQGYFYGRPSLDKTWMPGKSDGGSAGAAIVKPTSMASVIARA
jgi:EAL domain-containing protein (putative c-di-GMP-specific phosphodiesterase class I)